MTPDRNFKMSRSTKIMLASMHGTPAQKSAWKKSMISAQLHNEAAQRNALKLKENTNSHSRGAVAPD